MTREKEEEIFLSLSKSPIFEEENGARGEKERVPTAFPICPPLSIPSNAHTSGRKNGTSDFEWDVRCLCADAVAEYLGPSQELQTNKFSRPTTVQTRKVYSLIDFCSLGKMVGGALCIFFLEWREG